MTKRTRKSGCLNLLLISVALFIGVNVLGDKKRGKRPSSKNVTNHAIDRTPLTDASKSKPGSLALAVSIDRPQEIVDRIKDSGYKAVPDWRKSNLEGWIALLYHKEFNGASDTGDMTLRQILLASDLPPHKNEVNCQVLGPDESQITEFIPEIEIRHEDTSRDAILVGLKLIRLLDPKCPRSVLKTVARRQNQDFNRWKVTTRVRKLLSPRQTQVDVTVNFYPDRKYIDAPVPQDLSPKVSEY